MGLTVTYEPNKVLSDIDSKALATRSQALFQFTEDFVPGAGTYQLKLEIYKDYQGPAELLTTLFYSIPSTGIVNVDLGNVFYTYLEDKSLYPIDINYYEIFNGGAESFEGRIEDYQAIEAYLPINEPNGSNMLDYIIGSRPVGPLLARGVFLSKLNKPQYITDEFGNTIYPVKVPLLIDQFFETRIEGGGGGTVAFGAEWFDINGASEQFTLSVQSIPNPDNPRIFNFNLFFNPGWPWIDTSYTLDMFVSDGINEASIRRKYTRLTIGRQAGIRCKYIILEWVNEFGGVDYYAFEYEFEVNETSEVGETIIPPITSPWEDTETALKRRVDNNTQRITLTDERVDQENISALHYMKKSDEVYAIVNPGQEDKVRVIVEDTYTTQYLTRPPLVPFNVTIRFPNNYNFLENLTLS